LYTEHHLVARRYRPAHRGKVAALKLPDKGYLGGKRPVLAAWIRLGILIPLTLFAASMVLLGATNVGLPRFRPQVLFVLIVLGFCYWLYASVAIFHCALNEKRHPWLGGVMIFLMPFQAYGVIRGLFGNVEAILSLVGT